MGLGNIPETFNEFEGYGFQHELDDYINSFAGEDQFNLFFDEEYYNGFGEPGTQILAELSDSAIDPRLRNEPDVPSENCHTSLFPTESNTTTSTQCTGSYLQAAQGLIDPQLQNNAVCSSTRKLRRKSKKDESTHNHNSEASYPLYDNRLYELARNNSTPFKCSPPVPTRCSGYVAAPGIGNPAIDISQSSIDEFLASIDPTCFDQSIGDIMMADMAAQAEIQESPTNLRVIDQKEFTLRMLAPSAPHVQPSEKRKRGRPKKDEVDESHQDVTVPVVQPLTSYQAPIQIPAQLSSFTQPPAVQMLHFPTPQYPPQVPLVPLNLHASSQRSTPAPSSDAYDENLMTKRPRLERKTAHRSMSKKEQAYLEMDSKVKLYDETNIHELLYYPSTKPGRTPCFWIQRHPYANTRIYEDHYRTWCRYRHCKGVETQELIRTATGELREKNYKHPRTIIAGNYQVAVDWEYVVDEVTAFKNDPEGRYEYDKRNVFDTIECFFHLRCFEQLVDFPQVVRTQLVQFDHRVLNKDKSRNKITKRKNKGGTNAAEIEWYLKEEAERWIQRAQLDWAFNPLPGSDDSLEKVLLNGKKQYNEKKGGKYLFGPGSEFGSPAPSEL